MTGSYISGAAFLNMTALGRFSSQVALIPIPASRVAPTDALIIRSAIPIRLFWAGGSWSAGTGDSQTELPIPRIVKPDKVRIMVYVGITRRFMISVVGSYVR
jgi:hypothetical protein